MTKKVLCATVMGIESFLVTVEADTVSSIPSFDIVGLPDTAVKESKSRVKAALRNVGLNLDNRRVTVNLAPGDLRKVGAHFDLPIALAVLCAENLLPSHALEGWIFIGELSLDGGIHPVKGVLSIIYEAKKKGVKNCVIPYENRAEASLVAGVGIFPAENIRQVMEHFSGGKGIAVFKGREEPAYGDAVFPKGPDFSDVKGQEMIKRAFAIAAAGQHNILITGPPGVGKTMLAQRLPSIMPPLSFEESIEVTKIFSVKGLLKGSFINGGLINGGLVRGGLITERPFRAAHHTISQTALVGGGSPPSPGEISLAHYGVLFLDEIAEFPRNVLEALRQPMEDKSVVISRIAGTVTYPSNFMLVAASNPCPCGYLGVPEKCRCTANDVSKYMGKISGPLLDRIDMYIETQPLAYSDLNDAAETSSSQTLREKVCAAAKAQKRRFKDEAINFNAHMSVPLIKKYCVLGEKENQMLEEAFNRLALSARAYHRILKLARTIADYDGAEQIERPHIAEAVGYRSIDRRLWDK